jgi:hypothetical protein
MDLRDEIVDKLKELELALDFLSIIKRVTGLLAKVFLLV